MYLVISHKGLSSVSKTFVDRFSTMFPVFSLKLEGDERYHFWGNIFVVGGSASEMTRTLGYNNERPPKDPVVCSWRGWGRMRGNKQAKSLLRDSHVPTVEGKSKHFGKKDL